MSLVLMLHSAPISSTSPAKFHGIQPMRMQPIGLPAQTVHKSLTGAYAQQPASNLPSQVCGMQLMGVPPLWVPRSDSFARTTNHFFAHNRPKLFPVVPNLLPRDHRESASTNLRESLRHTCKQQVICGRAAGQERYCRKDDLCAENERQFSARVRMPNGRQLG